MRQSSSATRCRSSGRFFHLSWRELLRIRGALLRRTRVDDSGFRFRLHLFLRDAREIVAWIIGWDLILEYAVGNMAVAVGWSGYFVKLCGSLFG